MLPLNMEFLVNNKMSLPNSHLKADKAGSFCEIIPIQTTDENNQHVSITKDDGIREVQQLKSWVAPCSRMMGLLAGNSSQIQMEGLL